MKRLLEEVWSGLLILIGTFLFLLAMWMVVKYLCE